MAIAVIQEFEATLAQYDTVLAALGLTAGGTGAPGGLFHWVTPTEKGFRVTDVWESQEVFEAFAASSIVPAAQDAGITVPPSVTFLEVHNYLTAG